MIPQGWIQVVNALRVWLTLKFVIRWWNNVRLDFTYFSTKHRLVQIFFLFFLKYYRYKLKINSTRKAKKITNIKKKLFSTSKKGKKIFSIYFYLIASDIAIFPVSAVRPYKTRFYCFGLLRVTPAHWTLVPYFSPLKTHSVTNTNNTHLTLLPSFTLQNLCTIFCAFYSPLTLNRNIEVSTKLSHPWW